MKTTTYNFGSYIFEIKGENLFVIDNPVTDLTSMDFIDIRKIDSIYNFKSKSSETDFAIAIIINGSFFYRTVDRTKDNISKYEELIEKIIETKRELIKWIQSSTSGNTFLR